MITRWDILKALTQHERCMQIFRASGSERKLTNGIIIISVQNADAVRSIEKAISVQIVEDE